MTPPSTDRDPSGVGRAILPSPPVHWDHWDVVGLEWLQWAEPPWDPPVPAGTLLGSPGTSREPPGVGSTIMPSPQCLGTTRTWWDQGVGQTPPGPARLPQYLQGLPQLLPASQFPPQPLSTGHWGAAGAGVAAPNVLGVVAHGVPPPINVVEEFLLVQP